MSSSTNDAGNQVYFNRAKDSIWSYIKNMKGMYVAEKNTGFNWKLEKGQKEIGSYTCNKATTTYKGRTYTAWYTLEIPLSYGPWKFNGLPGLILEAYDTEYKIYYFFKNIEYPLKKEIKIDFIKESIEEPFIKWYSYKQYLTEANSSLENAYETMLIMFKEKGWTHKPIMPNIEQQRIEIAE
nr:GLPGLI family protein [Flavobacterium sp. N1861]